MLIEIYSVVRRLGLQVIRGWEAKVLVRSEDQKRKTVCAIIRLGRNAWTSHSDKSNGQGNETNHKKENNLITSYTTR